MLEAGSNNRALRMLTLALWVVAMLLVAAYTVGLVVNRQVVSRGWIVEALGSYPFAVGAAAIGALAARRRPANPVGWMLLVFALVLATNVAVEQYAIHGLLAASPHWRGAGLAAWFQVWGTFLFFPYPLALMFLLFPDGHLPSHRFRPLVWLIGAFWVLSVVSAMLIQGPVLSSCCSQRLLARNPVGGLPGFGLLQVIGFLGVVVILPFAVMGLVRKARKGGDEVRHQVRWLAYVVGLAAVAFAAAVVAALAAGFGSQVSSSGLAYALFNVGIIIIALGVPMSVGIAILKYKLYDIDVVINKTVVYALLAAFITAAYAAIVVGVGAAVRSGISSGVLPVIATAIIAVAFQPVRERARRVARPARLW